MFRGIIFDCDGTLVDSRARMVPFYSRLFAECGLPPLDAADPETVAACVSLADADLFARFVPDPEARATVAARAAALSDDDLTADLALMPHALETLRALRPTVLLGVATNRVGDMAAVTRRFSFDRHVDVIVTAADVDRPKPAPDMLLLAAERLGLQPHEVLFVGDTEVDRDAARAAGMAFVLYDPGRCPDRLPAPRVGSDASAVRRPDGGVCVGDLAALADLAALGDLGVGADLAALEVLDTAATPEVGRSTC